jgi:ABC-2 type transport system ATP-binding protein
MKKKAERASEGMKVKFNLTMALSHHADFLILDEPTSGLDPCPERNCWKSFWISRERVGDFIFYPHYLGSG